MTGDGTNDAPALAQADVAVAMNTGTQAAKEAGNMVDLDSNPTKLIEIVEIGKQMLMTRGALTTFSIANDVAKYFAIIPAAFATTYPALDALNVMRLATPQSAILSAVIFNALIIVALIPLALRGVRYRAARRRRRCCAATCWIYGVGGLIVPFLGIKLIDMILVALRSGVEEPTPCVRTSVPRSSRWSCCSVVTGLAYPAVVTGIAQLVFPRQANGSLIVRDGKVVGSALIGQPFDDPKYFWGRPVGDRRRSPTTPARRRARTWARRTRRCSTRSRAASRRCARPTRATRAPVPVDLVTASGSGLDPHISPAAALYQVGRVAKARKLDEAAVRQLVDAAHRGPAARVPRRAAGQRARR